MGVSSVINMEKTPSLLGKISSILQLCCSWGALLTALTSAALKESSRKGLLRITLIKYALTTGFPVYPIMNMNNHAILLDSKNNHVLKLFPHCQNPTADFFRDIWSSTVVLSQQVSPICSPPPNSTMCFGWCAVCAETRSSADQGKFLCVDFKSQFNMWM